MKFDSFLGGSHEAQSWLADQQDTMNLYYQPPEAKGDRPKLLPTPGVEELDQVGGGAGRAHFFQNGREFAVIGTTFYEVSSAGLLTNRGTVTLGSNPATISSNGDAGGQLFVTSGDNGYIFDLDTNTLSAVAALAGKATFGAHLDGYFVALDANTSTLYVSNLAPDGDVWDTGEDFAQRSLAPDRWISMAVLNRYIWLLGEQTSEVWYDTGQEFPFAPTPDGGVIPYGIAAPFSVVVMGDHLTWLGTTKNGRFMVLRARGVQPEVVSTKALEAQIESYSGVATAVADAYSERGHTFYLLNFDQNNVTYAFDSDTREWAKRGTWVVGENRFVSWRPRYYAFAHGEHRILDAFGGAIYRMSSDLSTDVDGLPIKRVRRAPAINEEGRRIFYPTFALDVEAQESIYDTTDAPLVANFTWVEDAESNIVSFDASTSVGDITDWEWDFGDSATDTGETVQHTYSAVPPDDSFTVTLTVTGPAGTAEVSGTVTTVWATGASGSVSGSLTATDTVGRAPQIMLRLSNDGGKTWFSERWRSAGKAGEWGNRVRWERCGSGRRRVFETSWTDPGIKAITGCYLNDGASNG